MCVRLRCLQPRGIGVCHLKAISQGILSFVVPTSAKGFGFYRILAVHTGEHNSARGGGGNYGKHSLPKTVRGDRFQRGTLICVTGLKLADLMSSFKLAKSNSSPNIPPLEKQ